MTQRLRPAARALRPWGPRRWRAAVLPVTCLCPTFGAPLVRRAAGS